MTPIDVRAREQREELLRRLLDAQNRHDTEAVVSCFAHPRYELVGNQRVYEGADEVRRYLATTADIFPDLAFEVRSVHHADDATVAELVMTGTHTGDRPGFTATGHRFRCRVAALFQFTGDQLVCARLYYDTGTIARQLA